MQVTAAQSGPVSEANAYTAETRKQAPDSVGPPTAVQRGVAQLAHPTLSSPEAARTESEEVTEARSAGDRQV
jgi:hypothetical protein